MWTRHQPAHPEKLLKVVVEKYPRPPAIGQTLHERHHPLAQAAVRSRPYDTGRAPLAVRPVQPVSRATATCTPGRGAKGLMPHAVISQTSDNRADA